MKNIIQSYKKIIATCDIEENLVIKNILKKKPLFLFYSQ